MNLTDWKTRIQRHNETAYGRCETRDCNLIVDSRVTVLDDRNPDDPTSRILCETCKIDALGILPTFGLTVTVEHLGMEVFDA